MKRPSSLHSCWASLYYIATWMRSILAAVEQPFIHFFYSEMFKLDKMQELRRSWVVGFRANQIFWIRENGVVHKLVARVKPRKDVRSLSKYAHKYAHSSFWRVQLCGRTARSFQVSKKTSPGSLLSTRSRAR